jgi:hypothetical protein
MSYCSFNNGAAFGREDRAMLEAAGYVTPAASSGATATDTTETVGRAVKGSTTKLTWTQWRTFRAAQR